MEKHPAGVRIDSGYRAPSFHGSGYDPVIHQFELNGFIRRCKGGFGFSSFPTFPMETLIVLASSHICGASALRLFSSQRWRPAVHNDPQLVGSIQRLLLRLGNDEGHSIADMSHLTDRQGGARGLNAGCAVDVVDVGAAGDITNAVCTKILSGVDGEDAGQSGYRIPIDLDDAREHAGADENTHRFIVQRHISWVPAPRVKR